MGGDPFHRSSAQERFSGLWSPRTPARWDKAVPRVACSGPRVVLPAPYDASGLAVDAVVACAEAAVRLGEARGLAMPPVEVDSRAVAVAVSSERHLRIDGSSPAAWAPLSGFFAAADGWVRLHGNYAHHAAAVRTALGLASDATRDDVVAEIAQRAGLQVEDGVVAAGGVAAAVRTADEWRASEHGRAGGRTGESCSGAGRRPLPPGGSSPADGLRVLDLTRVLAGPVAGRTLSLWGAEVLRIDRPDRPEIDWQHVDLDPGKRTTLLDLGRPADADRFDHLASDADVVLLGYRPGALHALHNGGADLLARHPHLVVVELSAWGWSGPWAGRRGFDSIVQAATGIARGCADADGRPGALPAQVLDHSTGYRVAATALDGVRQRPEQGGRLVRLSLLGAAEELLARPRPTEQAEPFDPEPYLGRSGAVRYARPPFQLGGQPVDHPFPARPFGGDDPVWTT